MSLPDFSDQEELFIALLEKKSSPNEHEKMLLQRAETYVSKLSWIPGIELVAIVNSLSFFATHPESDIDLFIITKRDRLWIVRVAVTLVFAWYGVWRKGRDIAGNFCLSFFVTEDAIDLEPISIEDDIYLYFWIAYLMPLLERDGMYERFLAVHPTVRVDPGRWQRNTEHMRTLPSPSHALRWTTPIREKSLDLLEAVLRYFGEKKAERSYQRKGSPEGVIITRAMLKFHDRDRRREYRDRWKRSLQENQ